MHKAVGGKTNQPRLMKRCQYVYLEDAHTSFIGEDENIANRGFH